ncbi:MAG TPA: T9SS type A sorting domain-containing protein [Bacteroidia bacterium]|nr:T9SS type A sorting domain-containing protein [Bacteroidia bacterium]
MQKLLPLFLLLIIQPSISAQTGECGTVVPPGYAQSFAQKIAAVPQPDVSGGPIVIPVQVHLFRDDSGNSSITLQDIQAELDSANFFYANAGLIFFQCLAPEVVDDNNLYNYDYSQENYVVTNHYMANVVNLYFANTVSVSGPVCGYTHFPGNGPDACFVSSQCMNGSTLAHELGHYFGLMHTHGGSTAELVDGSNCSFEGDLICDTPADPGLSGQVDSTCFYTGTATDANNMPYQPDVSNIMSYSRKICRNSFTSMQYSVINMTYFNDRYYLGCSPLSIQEEGINSIGIFPNPAVDIITLTNLPQEMAAVSLVDLSGRIVFTRTIIPGETAIISIQGLEPGAYSCFVSTTTGTSFKKVVILR